MTWWRRIYVFSNQPPLISAPSALSAVRLFGNSLNFEDPHHSRLQVPRDVTMHHPAPGIRHLPQQLGGPTPRNQDGVLPDQIVVGNPVLRQHQKSLAVQMDGMDHGVERIP